MSDELKNEFIPDSVTDALEDIAEDIVMDAIADSVEEKVEELSAPEEVEPVVETTPVVEETPVIEPVKEDVITTPSFPGSDNVNMVGLVGNGAIGSVTGSRPKKPSGKKSPATAKKAETVAIFSTRNVTWTGVGKVYRGYNIVEKAAADKWLTRDHIRPASPEEVAQEFGR
jgi:hypothetical protein